MARLAHLDSRPSFDSSDKFSFSANTPRYISFPEALALTADGKMSGRDFYDQSPKDLCNLLNDFSQKMFGKTFLHLETEELKEVCRMLAVLFLEVAKEKVKESDQTSLKTVAAKPQSKEIISSKVVAQPVTAISEKPQPKGIVQKIKQFFGWF